jgi:hypothetical protein
LGDINILAAWTNIMLHTELATRGSARVFMRYHDLLADWTTSVFRAGNTLGIKAIQHAGPDNIDAVHDFIDPALRRMHSTWDDFSGPGQLRVLAEGTWDELNKLAEPDGDTAEVQTALDSLREQYTALYLDAEAIARSSLQAAARRATARATGTASGDTSAPDAEPSSRPIETPARGSRVERLVTLVPGGVRARVPARVRARIRGALRSRSEAKA